MMRNPRPPVPEQGNRTTPHSRRCSSEKKSPFSFSFAKSFQSPLDRVVSGQASFQAAAESSYQIPKPIRVILSASQPKRPTAMMVSKLSVESERSLSLSGPFEEEFI